MAYLTKIKLVLSFGVLFVRNGGFQFFSILFLTFLQIFLLTSCETMEKLRLAYQGENLNTIDVFGKEKIDLTELDKISLNGFSISDFHHPLVRKHINLYQRYGKQELSIILSRGSYYLSIIKKIFQEKGIPLDLAYLPIIESGFNPRALSHAGASGLWQFMFYTGKAYKLDAGYWFDDRRDIYRSTLAAAYHLRYLYKRFNDWLLVLAAYNAGGGKISRAIKKYKTRNYWNLIKGAYLKPETKNYVAKFIAATLLAQNPEKYGLVIKKLTPPKLTPYKIEDATDIRFIASSASIRVDDFKRYNPQIKQWATPPSRSYQIYIPSEKYQDFVNELNKIPKEERVTYRQHFVNIGENLTIISRKFNVPINPIAEINKFKSLNDIQAGSTIVIPIQGLSKARKLDQKRKASTEEKNLYTFLYLVQPTDTLYKVALKFQVSIRDLMRWNKFKSVNSLRGGRLIIIKI